MEVTITSTVFRKLPNGNYSASGLGDEITSELMAEIVREWNTTRESRLSINAQGNVVLDTTGEVKSLDAMGLFR